MFAGLVLLAFTASLLCVNASWILHENKYCPFHEESDTDSLEECQRSCVVEGEKTCEGVSWNPSEDENVEGGGQCKLLDKGSINDECEGGLGHWDVYQWVMPESCWTEDGVDYNGLVIDSKKVYDVDGCCEWCHDLIECDYWSLDRIDGTCTRKRRDTNEFGARYHSSETTMSGSKKMYPTCNVEYGVDYEGNDIEDLETDNEGKCCNYCSSHETCQFWTYNRELQHCSLKSSASKRVEKSSDASGTRADGTACEEIEYGYDYVGNDICDFQMQSEGQCCDRCTSDVSCRYWTFDRDMQRCFLKSGNNGRVVKSNDVSGTRAGTVTNYTPHTNYDCGGNDIKSITASYKNGDHLDTCAEECSALENCVGFNFPINQKALVCFLKSAEENCGSHENFRYFSKDEVEKRSIELNDDNIGLGVSTAPLAVVGFGVAFAAIVILARRKKNQKYNEVRPNCAEI